MVVLEIGKIRLDFYDKQNNFFTCSVAKGVRCFVNDFFVRYIVKQSLIRFSGTEIRKIVSGVFAT